MPNRFARHQEGLLEPQIEPGSGSAGSRLPRRDVEPTVGRRQSRRVQRAARELLHARVRQAARRREVPADLTVRSSGSGSSQQLELVRRRIAGRPFRVDQREIGRLELARGDLGGARCCRRYRWPSRRRTRSAPAIGSCSRLFSTAMKARYRRNGWPCRSRCRSGRDTGTRRRCGSCNPVFDASDCPSDRTSAYCR